MNEEDKYFVEGRKFNWSKLYGELGSGEYEFILSDENSLTIRIKFTINQDGKLVYDKPTV